MSGGGLVEITSCQLCGSRRHSEVFREEPYSVMKCDECGLVFVTPRHASEKLREIYAEGYWKSDKPRVRGYSNYVADERLYLKTYQRRRRFLQPVETRRLKILDVGCAAGFFLRVMREHGHEVYGVEPSAAIAQHARRHLGEAAVHVGTLDDLPHDQPAFAPGSFDLVTMWDVVEHVPDPQALLRRARTLLRPDGALVIETQNVSSGFAKLLGRRWHHYKHAEHLYHFDPRTVRRLLEDSGFTVEHNTPAYGGKYVSLSFIAERAARLHAVVAFALKPIALLKGANLYLNFRDEMVILARPTASAAREPANGQPRAPAVPAGGSRTQ